MAVIGAGVAGASVALGLAREGARPLLLEAGGPATGGAGGDGLVRIGIDESPARLADAVGRQRAASVVAASVRGAAGLAAIADAAGVAIRRGGTVALAESAEEAALLARDAAVLTAGGATAVMLSAADARARAGGLGERFVGGMLVEDELVVDPGALLAALRAEAVAAGAELVPSATVIGTLDRSDGRIELRLAHDAAPVRAELVVVAAGAESGSVDRTHRDSVWLVRHQLRRYRRRGPLPASAPPAGSRNHGIERWLVPAGGAGDEVVVSGLRWIEGRAGIGERDRAPSPRIGEALDRLAREWLGELLTEAAPAAEWVTFCAHGCDGLPLVGGAPGQPRRLVIAGFGRSDLALPHALGLAMAAEIGGAPRAPGSPLGLFAPSRMV